MKELNPELNPPDSPYPSFLIFGPPGSGKGTQSKYLTQVASFCHISTGAIFRGLSQNSPSGLLFHRYADQGLLLPDAETIKIWHCYVEGLIATNRFFPEKQYLLLDGIPRTFKQAQVLDAYIDVKKILIIDLEDKNVLVERLKKRAFIEGRVDDADEDVLSQRMREYEDKTMELLEFYPEEKICRVNANQSPIQVFRDILIHLADFLSFPKK